jgi:acetoin utilization deacetylase AcuC-like enzyme
VSAEKKIGWCWDAGFDAHAPLLAHPERPQRLTAIVERLTAVGWLDRMVPIPVRAATVEQVCRVHDREHVEWLREVSRGGGSMLDLDTYCSRGSFEAAMLAAGAAIAATEAVIGGHVQRAFCAVRPPGHHAMAQRAMGFCLLNNAAIAARHAQRALGVERVLIVDFDAHHGNGVQAAFYEDPAVFYFSVHQFPFYPGSGADREVGRRRGTGMTCNVPLAAGQGDEAFIAALERALPQAVRDFAPELLLICAGFDGHQADVLTALRISTAAFGEAGRLLGRLADALCGGRMVSVLEGGYELAALAASVEAYLSGQAD